MFSLLVLAAAGSSGCLVAEAPEYGPPRKTTPVIDWQGVTPGLYNILQPLPPTQSFTIPVRSEDAGDGLVAYLYLDYLNGASPGSVFLYDWDFPAHPTADSHNLIASWPVPDFITPECHQLTMFVTHRSNYSLGGSTGVNGGRDPEDIAAVSWWATFDPNGDTRNLVDCPTPATP